MREVAPGRNYDEPSSAVTMLRAGEAPNVLPKEAEAVVDLRVPPGMDPRSVISEVRSKLPEGCEARVGWIVPPVSVKPADPVPRSLIRSILSLNRRPKLLRKYGSSDMNVLHGSVASIAAYGPGDGRMAHTDLEAVSVADLEFAVEVYRTAVNFLSSQPTRAGPTAMEDGGQLRKLQGLSGA